MSLPIPPPPPSRSRAWTDLQALAVAIQQTKNRGEAAALVATWRTPRQPPPAPVASPPSQTAPDLPPGVGARMVLDGLKNRVHASGRPR